MKKSILAISLFFFFGAATMTAQNAPKSTNATTAAKCTATTQKGTQCKNTANHGQVCGIHDTAAATCGATTKTGGKCRRHVAAAGARCHSHSHSHKAN